MENKEQTPQDAPNTQTESGPQPSSAGATQPGQELLDELAEVADKFAVFVRTAWNSDQRKQVEADVRTTANQLAQSIEQTFQQASTSAEAKDLQNKAVEVGQKVTASKFFADISGALTVGLRSLSDQLDKVSQDLQAKSPAPAKPADARPADAKPADADKSESGAKDIPINKG